MKKYLLIYIFITITCLSILSITALMPLKNTGLFQCFKTQDKNEKNGCKTTILVEQAINQLQKEIDTIEQKSSSARKAKNEILQKEKESIQIKEKFDITKLELEKKQLEIEQKKIGYKIYGTASDLYNELDIVYAKVTEDREIMEITKEINKLRRKAKEKMEKILNKIQEVGKKIIDTTQLIQTDLNQFRQEKIIPIKQELEKKLLTKEVDQELDKIRTQTLELQAKLKTELTQVLTSQEQDKIYYLKNAIERLKNMLNAIQNPESILSITEDQLLGIIRQ